jgi:hypothetical protein
VDVITDRARQLVLEALDAGWAGPPFDPLRLLSYLRIDAVPRDDVMDARTVPLDGGGVRVEFNPNRPSGRVRYSIAHEIAHTLFPDCAQLVRQRARHQDVTDDEWQLEALCNIGAAEILMPYGSVQARLSPEDDIERLLGMRREYDVSTEALLIRAIRLSDAPSAMFCASRLASGPATGRFRLDYAIPSRAWRQFKLPKGTLC